MKGNYIKEMKGGKEERMKEREGRKKYNDESRYPSYKHRNSIKGKN